MKDRDKTKAQLVEELAHLRQRITELEAVEVEQVRVERVLRESEAINTSRLHLIRFSIVHSLDELLEETLNETEKLTDSLISFYHFVDDDQVSLTLQNWSTRTKSEFCNAEGKGTHYAIAEAGVWVDCVYQRKPVIHNDYASLPHRKGMPEGHAAVIRELVVPVIRGEKIMAILGVGNKPTDYTHEDVETASLFADLAWEIAERKRAEERLKEQYSTLRGIIDSANALIFSVDRQYRYTSFNQGHAAVMKALYGVEIEIGHSLLDYMTVPEDRETAKDNLDRALAGEQLVEEAYSGEELRSRRYFQVSHSPIKAETGEIIGVAMLAQDRTEYKRAEEALRENETRYRAIVEAFDGLIYICSQDYRIEFMNKQLIERTGYDGTGQVCYEVLHDLDSICPWCVNDQVFDGETVHWEVQSPKDNHWYYVVNTPIYHTDGSMSKQAMILDVTERRRAEETLRASEERLQLALEAAQMGQWDWNIVTGEVVWSQQCLALYGLPPDIPMSYERFLQVLHPEDRERVDAALRRAVEDRTSYDELKRVVWPDGSVHWTASRGQVYCDATGQPIRMTGVTFDITKWKETEEALRGALAELTVIHQNAPIAMMLVDRDRIVRKVNEAAALFAGRPGEEMLGLRKGEALRCLHHLDDPRGCGFGPACATCAARLAVLDTFATHVSKRDVEAWMPFLRDDSVEERCLLVSTAYLQMDGTEQVLVCAQDITDRKQIEQSLIIREQAYRALVENSPDYIARYDREFRRIYVNPAIQKLFGTPVEDVLNKTPAEQSPVYAPQIYIDQLRQVIETATECTVEMPFRTAQGVMHWGHMRFVPEFGPEGQVASVLAIGRDIHEIKESERRFRTLAENFPDFVVRFDHDFRYTYVNPAVEKAFGLPAEAFIGKTLHELPHRYQPEQNDALVALIRRVFDEGVANETEARWDTEMGERIFEIRYVPEKDATGNVVTVLGIAHDITERRQAEEELRQKREAALQFSAQLAALQQVTIQLSKAKSSDDLCRRAVELARSRLGFDRVGIWFIEEDRGFLRGSFGVDEQGKLRDERDLRTEFRHEGLGWQVFSQKQPVAHSQNITLEHQGQEVGEGTLAAGALWDGDQVIGLIYSDNLINHQPITEQQLEILRLYATTLGHLLERKWAEKERERLAIQIREQAQELRHILATVPEGVLLLDSERCVVQANPIAEKDLATLAGVKVGDVLTHLGDRTLAELLTSPPTKGLWHEVKADQRVFEVIARPMENGLEPEHWVLVINDVTQAHEVRKQLQQQEQMAAVGQLAAGIAHDFNNIMAIIILYAQMTAKVEALPTHVQERMVIIDQQARHATRLIQQILDFSRRSVLERQPLDLLPLLKEQCKLLERTLPENIEISLDYEPVEYIVNADPTRMQQVIMNLAVNARDAMPKGGKLRFALARTGPTDKIRCVACDEKPSGEWVRITVTDTGSGIPSEVLPHIFEPFFTTKAPRQGTGLGLSQVYGIVGAHEGHIDVNTKMGEGTTFIVYLPPLLTHQPETPLLETLALVSGRGETLLVVEDDTTLRNVLAETLRSLNYRVLEAANGQEALDTLQQSAREIALVISDLVMPEMGGQALFHAMRQRNLTLPVIMLSGHPMEQELRNLQAQGLAGWLRKPPDMEQLSQLLTQVLKKNS